MCLVLEKAGSYKNLLFLNGRIEEFNANLFFVVSVFAIGIGSDVESIKYAFLIWALIMLIVLMGISPVVSENHKSFRKYFGKRPVLMYSFVLWLIVLFISYFAYFFLNNHFV